MALRSNAKASRRYPLRLPPDTEIRDLAFSPQGDRIAFVVAPREDRPVRNISLWVSKSDGSAMRKIGAMEVESLTTWGMVPYELAWLPSGKRLSFRYRESLYTVPVD